MAFMVYGKRTDATAENDNDNRDFIYYCHTDADTELEMIQDFVTTLDDDSFTVIIKADYFLLRQAYGNEYIIDFFTLHNSQWVQTPWQDYKMYLNYLLNN